MNAKGKMTFTQINIPHNFLRLSSSKRRLFQGNTLQWGDWPDRFVHISCSVRIISKQIKCKGSKVLQLSNTKAILSGKLTHLSHWQDPSDIFETSVWLRFSLFCDVWISFLQKCAKTAELSVVSLGMIFLRSSGETDVIFQFVPEFCVWCLEQQRTLSYR